MLSMTTPSNPLAGVWGVPGNHRLGGRQARRISKRFAGVGVGITAARLREIASGAPCKSNELIDLSFALAVTEMQREERAAKFRHSRRNSVQALIVAGMVLVLLNLLILMAYAVLSMAAHY